MKILVPAIVLAALVGCPSVYSQSFIGNATPTEGQTGVFAYWNFNALSIATASAPGAGGVPTSISADFGSATLSLSSWGGTVDDFSGSTLNAQLSAPAEESLSLVTGGAAAPFPGNNTYIELSFSMANLSAVKVDFATRGSSTGFNTGSWSYSTNGSDFTPFGVNTATTSSVFALAPSVSTTALDGDSTVFLRYTLSGGVSSTGNNRIDNLTLTGTVSAIPEPSTYVILVGGLILAGVATRRRRSVQA